MRVAILLALLVHRALLDSFRVVLGLPYFRSSPQVASEKRKRDLSGTPRYLSPRQDPPAKGCCPLQSRLSRLLV